MSTPPPLPLSAEAQRIAEVVTVSVVKQTSEQQSALRMQLEHLARKLEVLTLGIGYAEDRMVGRLDACDKLIKSNQTVADRLFQAYMAMVNARVWSLIAPTPARFVALAGGAMIGGFAATWIWWSVHMPAVAMLP